MNEGDFDYFQSDRRRRIQLNKVPLKWNFTQHGNEQRKRKEEEEALRVSSLSDESMKAMQRRRI